MEILVVGTHEYEWALSIFARQFNLYWDTVPITYCGDREPKVELPPNFSFLHVPAYGGDEWPWEHWFGNGLRSILEAFVDPIVALFLPDHWLTKPVDKKGVRLMNGYMKANLDVMRGNLTAGSCLKGYGTQVWAKGHYEILQVHPSNPHCSIFGGCAGTPALWNRKNLIDILEPHWDLWQLEKLGTDKMVREWPRWRSVGIEPAPLHRAHGLMHGRPGVVSFGGMNERDTGICAEMLPKGWKWTN